MKTDILVTHQPKTSYRVAAIGSALDYDPARSIKHAISVDLPIDDADWWLGAIVGPSGSGKSTIIRQALPDAEGAPSWTDAAIVDDFPPDLKPRDIIDVLTAAGLSSVPAWLLPYRLLSTGQQFRADLARHLCRSGIVVIDEFTSTVDRQVGKACSVALSRAVRRRKGQIHVVVASCHYDILPWLEPDWVVDLGAGITSRDCLRRPRIDLALYPGSTADWPAVRHHHYLSADIHPTARCFRVYATIEGVTSYVGFVAVLPAMGRKGWWREHRTVLLPDFQGMGIGGRMLDTIAQTLWDREGKRFTSTTGRVATNWYRQHRPERWRLTEAPRWKGVPGKTSAMRDKYHAKRRANPVPRLTASWDYLPARTDSTSSNSNVAMQS